MIDFRWKLVPRAAASDWRERGCVQRRSGDL